MNETPAPRIAKAPFILGDLILIACAAYVAQYGGSLGQWQYAAMVAAVALGAWLAAWPFVLEFRAWTQLAETAALTSVTARIKDLDKVTAGIAGAVNEWQQLQQSSSKTVGAAEQIAEKMTAEARNFAEVLTKMNESEKSHLRLEVDKLRRAEGDWLGITVRILDHVHALHQAGVRSGQRNVIEQLGQFQFACRETARRIGIIPVLPESGTAFDEKAHQVMEGHKATPGAIIEGILAPGYTFQGQLVRLPMVTLKQPKPVVEEKPDPQLSFDQSPS